MWTWEKATVEAIAFLGYQEETIAKKKCLNLAMKSSTKACHGLRFIYTGKLRLSQTQQGDVCFLMGLLRAADQFCISAWKSIRSFTSTPQQQKSYSIESYSYLSQKKDATHLSSKLHFPVIEIPSPKHQTTPQNPSRKKNPPRCRLCKATLWEVFELGCGRRSFGSEQF